MSFQANTNYTFGGQSPDSLDVSYALIGPSTAANLGGGIFTLPDGVNGDIKFTIASLSTETIGVTISTNGTNYSAALIVVNAATGKDTANATLGNGTYALPLLRFGSPKYVKFTKSSTVDTGTVAVAVPTVLKMF